MNRRHLAMLCSLLAGLLGSYAPPCEAGSRFLEQDYSHQSVRLESPSTVTTWEDGSVRVFIAPEGAVLRQGQSRLVAPRMVVWFDRALSARPDVRAAVLNVYAEGLERADGQRVPVRLAEGRKVQEYGALYMQFRSTLSFVWDCPLNKLAEPVPSPLLARAEEAAAQARRETTWEDVPPPTGRERLESVLRTLSADEQVAFMRQDPVAVVFAGDVHGSYGNLDLRADAAVLWYDRKRNTMEIYAQGNVRISRAAMPADDTPLALGEKPGVADVLHDMRADELYINPKTARGLATNPEVRLRDPTLPVDLVYVVRGDEAFMVDSSTLVVKKASITQCEFARPHYRFEAETAQIVHGKSRTILSAWRSRLKAGKSGRTLFLLPFFAADMTSRAYLLVDYAVGTSTKFGSFLQTTWRPLDLTLSPPDWIDEWTVNLDYYGARGPAIGTDLQYEFGTSPYPRHGGRIQGYYVSDGAAQDDTGMPVPQSKRGRLWLQHRSQLSDAWRVDAEYYGLSDVNFLNEFFEEDFETEKTPESYLLARYLRGSTYLALLYKAQVNDFISQVEEKPSADLQVLGAAFGRLAYDGSLTAGLYDGQLSDQIVPTPLDPPPLTRLHTDQTLSLPFMAGIVRLNPFVRALATRVSRSAVVGGKFQDAQSRVGAGAGITASTTFSRVFGLSSERFNLNRLRHVIIPHVGLETLSVSGAASSDLIQMDAIDAIDSMTELTLGLRQRLETKRLRDEQWQSVNWAELDVQFVSRSSDNVMTSQDESFVEADFEMLLTDNVSIHSRDNRFGGQNLPDVLNVGISCDYLPRWAVDVDYDIIKDASSALSVDLNYQLSDRYRLILFEQYEFDSRGAGDQASLETFLVLRRILHNWVLDVGLHVEKANGEVALIFGFGPAGWGVFRDNRRAGRR